MGFLLYEQDLAEVPGPGELPDAPQLRTIHCSLDLAMPCNMACVGCPRRVAGHPLSEESAKGLRHWIVQRATSDRLDRIQVSFHGGEPLLQGELVAAVSSGARRDCERHGVDYEACLVTNGTLLDRAVARRLRTAGLSRVQVTLDGPRRVHDRRRRWSGGSSFRKIVDNLKLSREAFTHLVVRVNADVVTDDELQELVLALDMEGLLAGDPPTSVYAARTAPYSEQVRDLWKVFALAQALATPAAAGLSSARRC